MGLIPFTNRLSTPIIQQHRQLPCLKHQADGAPSLPTEMIWAVRAAGPQKGCQGKWAPGHSLRGRVEKPWSLSDLGDTHTRPQAWMEPSSCQARCQALGENRHQHQQDSCSPRAYSVEGCRDRYLANSHAYEGPTANSPRDSERKELWRSELLLKAPELA